MRKSQLVGLSLIYLAIMISALYFGGRYFGKQMMADFNEGFEESISDIEEASKTATYDNYIEVYVTEESVFFVDAEEVTREEVLPAIDAILEDWPSSFIDVYINESVTQDHLIFFDQSLSDLGYSYKVHVEE